jgi:23S rRNA pseudouridine2605 synthase
LWRRVTGPKHKVSMRAPLRIDATEVPMPPPLLYVYHKPKWVLSVRSDPRENRPCMDSRRLHRAGIPEAAAFSPNLHAVGRLDYDSSGLLLLSSDGTLTQRILHPKHEIPKEYTAVVTGRVNATRLSERLTEGVETAEGVHTAELLEGRAWEADAVPPYLASVKRGLPSYYNQTDLSRKGCFDVLRASELSTVRLVVCEGKHRMVRRMLANCGHPVVDLTRNRIGSIELGNVKVGTVRELTNDELIWARSLLKDR